MLNDWFSTTQFPLSWEEFVSLPRHRAYRYEYRKGIVSITGNPRYYHGVLHFSQHAANAGDEPAGGEVSCFFANYELRVIDPEDWSQLVPLFAESLSCTAPLSHLSPQLRANAAAQLIARTRDERDGPLVTSACLSLADRQSGELLAGMLITLVPSGDATDFSSHQWASPAPPDAVAIRWGQPHLTWIFVSREHQRRRLASVLLREAASRLQRMGYHHLLSTFLLGDVASMLWHWRNGFQLLSNPAHSAHPLS